MLRVPRCWISQNPAANVPAMLPSAASACMEPTTRPGRSPCRNARVVSRGAITPSRTAGTKNRLSARTNAPLICESSAAITAGAAKVSTSSTPRLASAAATSTIPAPRIVPRTAPEATSGLARLRSAHTPPSQLPRESPASTTPMMEVHE